MNGFADARLVEVFADRDLYVELGVCPSTHLADLQSAYRRAALIAHPDKGGSAAAFQQLTIAFEVLSCPRTRGLYDLERERKRQLGCFPSTRADAMPEKTGVKRAAPKPEAGQKRRRKSLDSIARKRALARAAKVAKDASRRAAVVRLVGVLQSVRQVSSTSLRRMLEGMAPGLKGVLFKYMKTHPKALATAADERGKTSGFAAEDRPFYWGSSIRTIKHGKAPRYQPQIRMRHLRLQTRVNTDMEVALLHQTGLIHACNAVTTAGTGIWDDAGRFCEIFEAGLLEAGLKSEGLGLSAHVFMRADDMFCRAAVITSPVMSLGGALKVHAQLSKARQESWESLRAAWVPLMRSTRHAQRKALSESEAFVIADCARLGLLERRFERAIRAAERSIASSQPRRRMAGDDKRKAGVDQRPLNRAERVERNVRQCPGDRNGPVRETPSSFGGA